MSIRGKTALVTGSGRNIGRAIALHLARAGCNVVLNGSRDRAACEDVAAKIADLGAEAAIEMCDIGERDKALRRANPAGRLGTADDIAGAVDLLVSEQGGFINGQMLQVNGGVVNQF
jgi:3-oxoacyl-[acyl-carrier protein] reductase